MFFILEAILSHPHWYSPYVAGAFFAQMSHSHFAHMPNATLQAAGCSYAMANGREAAKQVAHLTTAMSNDDDGVIVQASLTRVPHTRVSHTRVSHFASST